MTAHKSNDDWRTIKVEPLDSPVRLDSYLGADTDAALSRTKAQQLIKSGQVKVDGELVAGKLLLKGGETISYLPPAPEVSEMVGEDIPLSIVFEDEYLAVINKPAGMVTHPGAGNKTGTLVNALIHHFANLSQQDPTRPGIVHRLDKGTSGLLLIAKSDRVGLELQKAIGKRQVKRIYLGIVCGHMPAKNGVIDLPLARSESDRTVMAVNQEEGRSATTSYKVLKQYRLYDQVEFSLGTGRTHQIRAHCAHLKHPILGDFEYGGREKWHRGIFAPERPLGKKLLELIDRQALHAMRLEFVHPETKKEMTLEAPLPEDIKSVIALLEREGT